MTQSRRQEVRTRDAFRCRYCGITEVDIGSTLTLDHIQPQSQGGDDSPDNLVYCCHPCNEFKGEYWQTTPELRLLNPLVDDITTHCREQADGTLLALTERGANHIEILHLNRPRLVEHSLRVRFYETQETNYRAAQTKAAALEEELRRLRRRTGRQS